MEEEEEEEEDDDDDNDATDGWRTSFRPIV